MPTQAASASYKILETPPESVKRRSITRLKRDENLTTSFHQLDGVPILSPKDSVTALCWVPCQKTFMKFLNVNINFMLFSNRKVSIPFVADAKMPIFRPGSKKLWFFTPNMRFHWEKLKGWSDKVEIFVTYRSKYLQKNDQNSVFVSEAIHGEIIIWNNKIFEKG